MSINSLDSGPKLFFSRRVKGDAGEDLVEKQNAEQGLMPVVASEAVEYGYEAENRYFVECFADGKQPEENFYDGLEVTELLMTAYMSAEQTARLSSNLGSSSHLSRQSPAELGRVDLQCGAESRDRVPTKRT